MIGAINFSCFCSEIDRPPGANYTAQTPLNQSRYHTTYPLKVI